MKSIKFALLFAILPVLAAPVAARGDWLPDPDLSHYQWEFVGPGSLTLMVTPTGGGSYFHEARTEDGAPADATITLTVLDAMGAPVNAYPREDLWLGWPGGGVAVCNLGAIADANTDADGRTRWTAPLEAGGWSQGLCQVYISGMVVTSAPGLPLHLNSPDLDGDRIVNLVDVQLFAQDYYGSYAFRSDLNGDGVVNLADIPVMARAMGSDCR